MIRIFGGLILIVLLLAIALYSAYSAIYGRGYTHAQAYYEKLLADAREAKAAADQRAIDIEDEHRRMAEEAVKHYEQQIADLSTRADRAERRMADSLRKLAAATTPRCSEVPEAGDPGGVDAAAESAERARLAAVRIRVVGEACESDALKLQQLQAVIQRFQELTE